MVLMLKKICLLAFVTLGVTFNANAAFILNGSTSVNALSLNQSFVDFYAYSTVTPGSSATGLEINDTVTFFIAEYSGSFALFGLADGTAATGDNTDGLIKIKLDETVFPSVNPILLSDDAADTTQTSATQYIFTFGFGAGKNDGFVYSLDDGDDFDILLGINYIRGLSDAAFLTFDSFGNSSVISLTDTSTLRYEAVSGPTTVSILGLAFLCLGFLRNRS